MPGGELPERTNNVERIANRGEKGNRGSREEEAGGSWVKYENKSPASCFETTQFYFFFCLFIYFIHILT